MQLDALIEEANRQLTICNACRYCEGYCAVFPALERRVDVTPGDTIFIANLCHDCRACYYACPFTPPHEFAIDLPRALSRVRRASYGRYAPLAALRRIFDAGARGIALATGAALLLVLAAVVMATGGAGALGVAHVGPGAFYEVVPWLLMVVPGMALGAYVVLALAIGATRFLRETGARPVDLVDRDALLTAAWEAITLRWLRGGGEGCHYPTAAVSGSRTVLHALVAGGFVAALASTMIAAFEQDVLDVLPPYPLLSAPVLVGAAGGIAMIVGSAGLLVLKRRTDADLRSDELVEFDVAFLVTIGLSSLTGMLVLAFRDTALMPALLVAHLAVLATLYVTAPYGKFAHATYRYAALVRNRLESIREGA